MMEKNHAEELDARAILAGQPMAVLDQGFVRVVDLMGNDVSIVQADRVSPGRGIAGAAEDADLINSLMHEGDTSPFEMCEIKLHIKLPIFVARQLTRHRIASVCERLDLPAAVYTPEAESITADMQVQQVFSNLCGSVQSVSSQALDYGERHDIAREANCINMTVAHYVELYWKIDLNSLFNFLLHHLDERAPQEIREYAQVIARIVEAWVPMAFDAFVQYRLHAVTFSLREQMVLAPMLEQLRQVIATDGGDKPEAFSAGEWFEFMKKLSGIGELTDENNRP